MTLDRDDPLLGRVRLCRRCGEAFDRCVTRGDGCWLWRGSVRTMAGYGQFKHHGARMMAHRASWELHNGAIPDGMFVLHRCDTPACVNPTHLFLGTKGDNNRDRAAKGRSARGERAGTARYSDSTILAMRAARARGETVRDIARHYGMDSGHASRVLRGLSR